MAVLFLVFFTSPILGLHKMPSSHREPCHRVHLLEQTIWKRMCVRAGAHLFVLFVYLCGARSKPLIHFYGVSFFSIFSSSEHIAKMQTLKCTNVFYFYLSSPWNLLFSSTNTLCQFNTELYMRANEWVLWKTTFFGEEIYSFCVYRGGFFLFILSGLNCLNNTIYLWKKKYFQDAFSSFSVYTQNFYCCCCCCSFSVSVIHNPHDMFSPNFKILNYEHGIRMERNEINIFEK